MGCSHENGPKFVCWVIALKRMEVVGELLRTANVSVSTFSRQDYDDDQNSYTCRYVLLFFFSFRPILNF